MNEFTNGIVNYSFIPDSKVDKDFTVNNPSATTEDWKNEKEKILDLASKNKIRNEAGITVFEEEGPGIIVTQTSDSENTTISYNTTKKVKSNITNYKNQYSSSISDENKNIRPKEPESDGLESPETSIDISIFEDGFADKNEKHENTEETNNNLRNTNVESDKIRTNDATLNFDGEDFTFKFVGSTYKSLRQEPRKSSWRRRSLYDSVKRKRPKQDELLDFAILKTEPELSRSQYSLVSTGELTAEALQVWKELPKKIKYDPEMAAFQQRYEKVYGKPETIHLKAKNGSIPETKRLPLVKSAPHLNNNIRVVDDVPYIDGKTDVEVQNPVKNGSGLEHGAIQTRLSKFALARHYLKMTMLLACWIFFTLVFLLYNEKEEIYRNSSVNPGEVKTYILNVTDSRLSIQVKLLGPFLSEHGEGRMNFSEIEASHKMLIWLERWTLMDRWTDAVSEADAVDKEVSNPWTIVLQDDEYLDFSKGEPRSSVISLATNQTQSNNTVYALKMRTTALKTTPFTMTYTLNPLDISTGVIYACLLLCGLYVLIIFEIINRTMAAVLISTTALATLAIVGERPTLPQLVSWLDMETLLLLFSMMLLVAIMAETGMFDFLAVFTFEVTKGKLWPLITLLCIITAFLSTFLDNVTTVLLMTPVTIRLCEVMNLDPVPILMSMVLFSNIGGTATPVGDPPNVIIASNKAIVQAGINFTNFTMHMTLGILVVCVQTYFQLRYIYRDTNKLRSNVPREIQDLRHQISIWRRAIESLPHLSKDQHVVRERLERKMKKLNVQLETMIKETNKRVCPKETFQSTLAELKQKYKIRDKMLLFKSTIAIGFVVILFFLHSIPELNRVSLGWTALLGAILLLTLADREDLEPILHRVEWSTLLFFASLFVLMEALSKLGLIEFIGGVTESLILRVDESARLAVSLLLMLWVSGVTSAFVDNIPLTTMMVRVVIALGSNPNLNLPMAPLIWALSFGACLGGNGTLIGASANVVCAGVAEQHGYRFTFMQFFKVGFPVMIGHLIVASGYLILCHCVFTWH